MSKQSDWYADWFNSPYYHTLYNHRDENEAKCFIEKLIAATGLKGGDKVLDLACGKGRHSKVMAEMGLFVVGADLSPGNIATATKEVVSNCSFLIHDMREPIDGHYFNAIFNLFTSFGYFESPGDDSKALDAVSKMLLPKGKFIFDFFNTKKVIKNLIAREIITKCNINFHIDRSFYNGFVTKRIEFKNNEQEFCYLEKVRAYTLNEIEHLFRKSGLQIQSLYGDYSLSKFDEVNSDRLVVISEKI